MIRVLRGLLRSHWIKAAALPGGFAGAFAAARRLIPAFDYYVKRQSWIAWLKMDLAPALLLFLAAAVLLCVSVWFSGGRPAPRWWRGLDYAALTAVMLAVEALCVFLVLVYHPISLLLFFLSLLAYTAFMIFLMETVARLPDRQLAQSLLWARFFRLYPPRHLPGFFMAVMLAGNFIYLAANALMIAAVILYRFVLKMPAAMDLQPGAVALLLASLSMVGLSYLCAFILTLSARYERTNEEKIRAERFKAELIANVSHDVRTPLTSIVNYVDLLRTLDIDHPDFRSYVDVLERKSARLNTLIGDLMEASKASTGNLPVNLQSIGLGEIIGQIAGEFDDLFSERGLTLVTRLPAEPVIAQADSGHLWRVLENLFGNAAKYALPGTRVFAEVTRRESLTVFSLKNTSRSPINPDAGALTEQFVRGDRARHTEGSGLGLYIAKSLMELMGGALEIRVTGDLFEAEVSLAS